MNKNKVTREWLIANNACTAGLQFVRIMRLVDTDEIYFINKLIDYDHVGWASWLLARRLSYIKSLKLIRHMINDVLLVINIEENKDLEKVLLILDQCIKRNCPENRKKASILHDEIKHKNSSYIERLSQSRINRLIYYTLIVIENKNPTVNIGTLSNIITAITYVIGNNNDEKTIEYIREGTKLL